MESLFLYKHVNVKKKKHELSCVHSIGIWETEAENANLYISVLPFGIRTKSIIAFRYFRYRAFFI